MKNKIYKGIIGVLPVVICLIMFSACKDPMKDYYGDGKYTAPGTESVLSVLKSNPEYSTFTYILEETGLDQMLKDNTLLTLWVPRNEDMPYEIATLTAEEKVALVKNHMSLGAITTKNLTNFSTVISLTDRYMTVSSDANKKVFYVDNSPLLNTDIMCANGVIQEISKWFIPRISLYDLLMSLSDEYSIFRDSLKQRTDSIFDTENSVAIGVDENGIPVYDSVKIGSNLILDKTDLSDMTQTFTFFIPTDEAMLQMFSDMTNYLSAAEVEITDADTSAWVEWIMKASIKNGYQTYAPGKVISGSPVPWPANAGTDYHIRTDYQIAYDQSPSEYSNGWAYTLNRISVPKTLYVKEQLVNPYYIRQLIGGAGLNSSNGLDEWTTPIGLSTLYGEVASGPKSGNQTVFWQFGRLHNLEDATLEAWYKYLTYYVRKDADGNDEAYQVDLMPGYYNIYMRFLNRNPAGGKNNRTDSIKVYINDDYNVTVSGIVSNIYQDSPARVPINGITPMYLSGRYGPAEIKLELFPLEPDAELAAELILYPNIYRTYRRIEAGTVRFEPVDNY